MRDSKAQVEAVTRDGLQAQRIPFDSIPIIDLEPWFVGDARARCGLSDSYHSNLTPYFVRSRSDFSTFYYMS